MTYEEMTEAYKKYHGDKWILNEKSIFTQEFQNRAYLDKLCKSGHFGKHPQEIPGRFLYLTLEM